MPRILVVDDDAEIAALIADSLGDEGFEVHTGRNGLDALGSIQSAPPDLLIIDVMMPEMDGLEVCRRVRSRFSGPIILVTAKNRELDKVIGLELGADDYITKPFSINELVARVKAHLRREERRIDSQADIHPRSILEFGNMQICPESFEVFVDGELIPLSSREFQILAYLAENRGRVLSREQIYDAVWGDSFGDVNTVTVHIKNIRSKLDPDNKRIKTVWGVGYKFTGQ